MALRKVEIFPFGLVLISLLLIISCRYYILCASFFNFYIVRRLRNFYILYFNSKVILTSHKYLPHHLLRQSMALLFFVCCVVCLYAICCLPVFDHIPEWKEHIIANLQVSIITICIWSGIFYVKKLTKSEESYLSSINNLTWGYGGAILYYKNYLNRIMPDKFLAGVKQFENKERVRIPHKLYILCPKSCRVKKYIDNTENIEHSKDLPSFKIDHGGIKDREYRVSVYRLEYNGEYFRCALDYAQPLKTLLEFKETGKISLSEMYTERERFKSNLLKMLNDRENSIKFCELVEYDDEIEDIHVVLSSRASLQEYKCKAAK